MTHLYTLLIGGIVIPGGDRPDAAAIAWAGDTVLAIGTDDEIRAISRGDSHVFDLGGASVIALETGTDSASPTSRSLAIGDRADLAVLDRDPRLEGAGGPGAPHPRTLALVRGGHVVEGALPGGTEHDSSAGHDPREDGAHAGGGSGAGRG